MSARCDHFNDGGLWHKARPKTKNSLASFAFAETTTRISVGAGATTTIESEPIEAIRPFEIEKWRKDVEFRERELGLKERELKLKAQEQDRLAAEARRSRLGNPLVLAVIAAAIAATGGAVASWMNGTAAQRSEILKAESARILEAIKATDPEKAKDNLRFLMATGLVSPPTAERIQGYLSKQPVGTGPFLPPSLDFSPTRLKREIELLSKLGEIKELPTGTADDTHLVQRP